jgi:hypothetical protein
LYLFRIKKTRWLPKEAKKKCIDLGTNREKR